MTTALRGERCVSARLRRFSLRYGDGDDPLTVGRRFPADSFDLAVQNGMLVKTAAGDVHDAIDGTKPVLARIVDRLEQHLEIPDSDIADLTQRGGDIRQSPTMTIRI
ncbi:hypothetical protein [Rhodococcoides yunnanense]|uniref:hypothetical protein n=1 Tax=Rhodococcoides yunnanense TaxID=278209 RepID=UPI0009327A6B|nr:hypothetical protein [Rhodococcus yunnanensis]